MALSRTGWLPRCGPLLTNIGRLAAFRLIRRWGLTGSEDAAEAGSDGAVSDAVSDAVN